MTPETQNPPAYSFPGRYSKYSPSKSPSPGPIPRVRDGPALTWLLARALHAGPCGCPTHAQQPTCLTHSPAVAPETVPGDAGHDLVLTHLCCHYSAVEGVPFNSKKQRSIMEKCLGLLAVVACLVLTVQTTASISLATSARQSGYELRRRDAHSERQVAICAC